MVSERHPANLPPHSHLLFSVIDGILSYVCVYNEELMWPSEQP